MKGCDMDEMVLTKQPKGKNQLAYRILLPNGIIAFDQRKGLG
jgi:hypothetical protein